MKYNEAFVLLIQFFQKGRQIFRNETLFHPIDKKANQTFLQRAVGFFSGQVFPAETKTKPCHHTLGHKTNKIVKKIRKL